MGQYYTPIVLDEDGNIEYSMYSHDFSNGLKLMEHSFMDNDFVAAFETLLIAEAPRRVVWAGDYADNESDTDSNLYCQADRGYQYRPDVPSLGNTIIGWNRDGKHAMPIYGKDPDIKANAFPKVIPTMDSHPFLVNWDMKTYVDKRNVPSFTSTWSDRPLIIHPLPLLTVEGNGRGGGDYDVSSGSGNFDLIGSWARDHLILRIEAPKGFEEIKFDLTEAK